MSKEVTRDNETAIQEILLKHKENNFYCKGYGTLEQVAQGDCRVALPRGIQKLSGHGLNQLTLGNIAFAISDISDS